MSDTSLPVLIAPVPNPNIGRVETRVASGMTIADIVATVLPPQSGAVRVYIVGPHDMILIDEVVWDRVRPKVGTRIVIRPVPAGNFLRSALQILVVVAAVALGQLWAPALAGFGLSQPLAAALITAGISVVGTLLINALIPLPRPDGAQQQNYALSGFQNQSNPGGPIPVPFGTLRFAPYYAAPPYTEIVGNIQYIRALFVWGYGPLAISDLWIGETPIDQYDEFTIETYSGYADDPQVSLYPSQVIEQPQNVELTRAWARDDAGNLISPNYTIEKPVIRWTASDATEAAVILGFPAGLVSLSNSGHRNNRSVTVRIRQSLIGTSTWTDVTTLTLSDASSVPIWRQYRWTLPTRGGGYQIELTRMTNESLDTNVSDKTVWQAIQSFRPEYPINFPHPVAVTALRVKATAQLSGNIDNLTGLVSRIAPDWDAPTQSWITRPTRSPAAAYRFALQGPAVAYPRTDAQLDLDGIQAWSEWCADNALYYDRLHDQVGTFGDALTDICHAGRATHRYDGTRWGVVVDRPQTLVVDHINPRNSRDFKLTRTYPKRPDGFRISFKDSSNFFHSGERIVPWVGNTGDVIVTEDISLPGKVDPDAIWIEARRRMYEIDLRPETIQITQDGAARVATRGDLVSVSYYVLQRSHFAARVIAIAGDALVLDDDLQIDDGVAYACRFLVFDETDTIGVSVVSPVSASAGTTRHLRLSGETAAPQIGDIVQVGPMATESLMCRVKSEERVDGNGIRYTLVAAAPEIDDLLAADIPPPYDGRTGTISSGVGSTLRPAVPRIVSITSGVDQLANPNAFEVSVAAGSGSAVPIKSFEIDYRLSTDTIWNTVTVPAASGGVQVTSFTAGQTISVQVRAIGIYNVSGPYTTIQTFTIGANDVVVPDITSLSAVTLSSGLRHFTVGVPTSTSTTVVGYQLRARPGTGWTWSQLSPIHTGYLTSSPSDSYEPLVAGSYTVGAVAIDMNGNVSRNPLLTTSTFDANSSTTLIGRLESGLGWPGTYPGATVSAGILYGSSTEPSSITYTSPIIDLGADKSITVSAEVYGVAGILTLSMRTGLSSDSHPVGSAISLAATTARYVQVIALVSNSSAQAVLGDLAILIAGSP